MNDWELAVKLYQLKLGELHMLDNVSSWMRVPGGWIYSDSSGNSFIPYNGEFTICKRCQEFVKDCICPKY